MNAPHTTPYTGRFAPSPTGPLHFGSLLAALASYLDARAHRGRWLVRIEDLDPPREVPGASDAILTTLECYGLHWDGEVWFQSRRLAHYEAAIEQLEARLLTYQCSCSRQQINRRGPIYDGTCRQGQPDPSAPTAIRLCVPTHQERFIDRIQGTQSQWLDSEVGDFVIRRKDRLFAYQLAVVVDDAAQGITQVVRGSDLLDSTPRQRYLQRCLGVPHPGYAHIPVLVNHLGQKLSKQTFAPALPDRQPGRLLWQALRYLGQRPPVALKGAPPAELLAWAEGHWQLKAIPGQRHFTFTGVD